MNLIAAQGFFDPDLPCGVYLVLVFHDGPVRSGVLRLVGGGAKHIIVLKLDRLFRDVADALTQTKTWDMQVSQRKAFSGHPQYPWGGYVLQLLSLYGHSRMWIEITSPDLEIQVRSGKWGVDIVRCIGGDGRAGKY